MISHTSVIARATFKMTPEDIELLFQSENQSESGVSVHDEGDDTLSNKEEDSRVLRLQEVLAVAHSAWVSRSEELDYIAEKLADGSRNGWSPVSMAIHSSC